MKNMKLKGGHVKFLFSVLTMISFVSKAQSASVHCNGKIMDAEAYKDGRLAEKIQKINELGGGYAMVDCKRSDGTRVEGWLKDGEVLSKIKVKVAKNGVESEHVLDLDPVQLGLGHFPKVETVLRDKSYRKFIVDRALEAKNISFDDAYLAYPDGIILEGADQIFTYNKDTDNHDILRSIQSAPQTLSQFAKYESCSYTQAPSFSQKNKSCSKEVCQGVVSCTVDGIEIDNILATCSSVRAGTDKKCPSADNCIADTSFKMIVDDHYNYINRHEHPQETSSGHEENPKGQGLSR